MIEQKLRDGMIVGQMHACLRDVGRIAGGCVTAGRLTVEECERLGEYAVSLAKNHAEATRKWAEAVEFGKKQPLEKTPYVAYNGEGHAVGWDEVVDPNDYKIVDERWLERETVAEPKDSSWNPCKELSDYLKLLFKPGDKIMFCTDPWKREGEDKWLPSKGSTRTYESMMKSLVKNTQDGFEEAVGTLNNDESGAWIRINPFDGEGSKDANVTDFRHVLVEFDNKPIDEQVAIYRKLELPCRCIVHSGGKSAHAIVSVDAENLEEYRQRVDFLFKVMTDNGLKFDKQNRNPSRYSRLPGVLRNGKKQYLIDRECGKASWDEWEDWIKEQNDDLPDFEPMTDEVFDNPPPLKDELISGVLRVSDNMIISGPSKAGKSFLLIELCVAVASGGEWIGHKCRQGNVLYVNLELNSSSCVHRVVDVCKELGVKAPMIGKNPSLFMWNLRGKAEAINKLAPRLIRRATKSTKFAMIVIDPAYMVFPGDENSSEDAGTFMKSLIKIAKECNSAIVLCHHHSKGFKGDKGFADNASGSGVFGRAPDAILDLLHLDASTAVDTLRDRYICNRMSEVATRENFGDESWKRQCSQDDLVVVNRLMGALESIFKDPDQMDAIRKAKAQVEEEFESVTGWRVSYLLRDLRSPKPKNLYFKYPCHIVDDEDTLKDAAPEGAQNFQRGRQRQPKEKKTNISPILEFKQIVECDPNDHWTIEKAKDRFGKAESTIWNWIKRLGWTVKHGVILVEGKDLKQNDIPF